MTKFDSTLSLSHIAIACPEIMAVADRLTALSLEVAELHDVASEKVVAAMIPVAVSEHFRIELLEPTADDSPIARFPREEAKRRDASSLFRSEAARKLAPAFDWCRA